MSQTIYHFRKMSEWKTYRLGDLIQLKSGGTPDKSNPNYWGGSIPWISAKSMYDDFISTSDLFITEEGLQAGSKIAKKDSILLLTRGSGLFNRIPICYVVSDVAYNQDVKNIVLKQENVTSIKFLYYWLYGNKELLSSMLETTGIGAGKIDTKRFLNLSISLPSQKEQARYIHLMDLLFDKIELNRRINANLEAQAQALFRSWFVDFEPFRDGPFVDSELGKIPQGWEVAELQTLVTIKRGGSPRPIQNFLSDSGYNWLKISDATSEQSPYIYDIKEHIKESGFNKTVYIKSGELVLSNSATPGIPKILGVDSCIHDGWLYFPKSSLSNEFLYLLFKENREKFLSQGNGSVFLNLKTDILKSFKIIVPNNLDELKKFNIILHNLFQEIKYKTEEIKNLSALRDTLLPKLMAGEINIE